jgi:hypothetical protein
LQLLRAAPVLPRRFGVILGPTVFHSKKAALG